MKTSSIDNFLLLIKTNLKDTEKLAEFNGMCKGIKEKLKDGHFSL